MTPPSGGSHKFYLLLVSENLKNNGWIDGWQQFVLVRTEPWLIHPPRGGEGDGVRLDWFFWNSCSRNHNILQLAAVFCYIWIASLLSSVTRFGDFLKFLATNFRIKVVQIFSDFLALFRKPLILSWLHFGQLLEKFGLLLFRHLVTLLLSLLLLLHLDTETRPQIWKAF